MPETRLTQLPIEVTELSAKPARLTQLPIDIIHNQVQPGQLTQLPVNIIYVPIRPAQLTQLPLGVTFNIEPVPPPALRAIEPVVERWQWSTTIVKGFSGREQRMSLREEPFFSITYNLAILNEIDRQNILYTFHRYIGRRLRYPLLHESTPLTASAAIGATELEFDPTDTNCRDNEAVAVYTKDMSSYRVLEITSVTGTGCTLALPLEENLSAGLFVAPAPLFRINDNQSMDMGVNFGESTLNLIGVPKRTLKRPGQTATISTFDGIPLLPDKYVLASNNVEGLARNLEVIENEAQDPIDIRVWHFPQVSTPRVFLISKEDMDSWREFGDRIVGRQKPFLAPSYREDFELSETPVLEATTLVTEDTFVSDWMAAPGYRYLRIETANGVIYRKCAGALLNLDRTVSIELTTPLGGTVGDNVITKISFMPKVRLSSDEIEIEHYRNYSLISFSVSTVDE